MVLTTTSTTVDSELLDMIRSKGYKINHLISLGYQEIEKGSQWEKRLKERDEENQAIQGKLRKVALKNAELEASFAEEQQENVKREVCFAEKIQLLQAELAELAQLRGDKIAEKQEK